MELEPFDSFGEEVDLSAEPTTPPPDPTKPYMWTGTEWVLVVTDTSDGVPDSLNLETDQSGKSLAPWERDVAHGLRLVDPTARVGP